MSKQLTPQEITEVAKQITEIQQTKGHKAGWTRYEMERRADKVEKQLYGCNTDASKLGWACYHIATNQQSLGDLTAELESNWEMYQEMVAQYGEN